MKAKKKWIHPRHRVVRSIAYWILYPYSRLRYGIKITRFREQEDRQYLILLNHQTPFDQFFVGMAFREPIYYMATEDLFSNGLISRLISWLVAPIPIKKQTTDVSAVLNCMRVAREGGSIAIAPEGNRTYSGRTEYIKPSIVPLVRKLKLPLVLYHIEGGYGAEPRWSDVIRRGPIRAGVHRIVEPEEYLSMDDDTLYQLIVDGLTVNEAVDDAEYRHKRRAEYLERAIYVCPDCGLSSFESHGDTVTCTKCGLQVRYLPNKTFAGSQTPFPFRFVADWYDYQCNFIHQLDPAEYIDTPAYRDTVRLSEVILYQRKQLIAKKTEAVLWGDRITLNGENYPFDAITVTVLGRNKLNLYHDGRVYQFKGAKRFNALKYVNFYHHYKNLNEENHDGKFLGL